MIGERDEGEGMPFWWIVNIHRERQYALRLMRDAGIVIDEDEWSDAEGFAVVTGKFPEELEIENCDILEFLTCPGCIDKSGKKSLVGHEWTMVTFLPIDNVLEIISRSSALLAMGMFPDVADHPTYSVRQNGTTKLIWWEEDNEDAVKLKENIFHAN